MQVLITRPQPDAQAQADLLRKRGMTPIISPLLEVTFEPPDLEPHNDCAALVVTSRNALRSVRETGVPQLLLTVPVFCVGPGTAALAREMGFKSVVAGPGDAHALVPVIRSHLADKTGPLLRLTGETQSSKPVHLDEALRAEGFNVYVEICYRIQPQPELTSEAAAALRANSVDLVILMSPVTATTYVTAVRRAGLTVQSEKPGYVCMSAAVAEALVGFPQAWKFVADKPNQTGLLSIIDRAVAQLS